MKFIGSKFDKSLTTKEIAARVRKEIKGAVKSSELPKAKYSVRIDSYSMGSSINIAIKAVPFAVLNPKRVVLEAGDLSYLWRSYNVEARYTAEAATILERVEQMLQSYNFDDSDSMTDYFHVNFYGHVKFDWCEESAERARILAELNAVQAVA